MKKLVLMSVFSLLLFACGTQKDITGRSSLQDTNWLMVDESGVVTIGEKKEAKPLYLRFPSSKVNTYTAFLGCNSINGKVSAGEHGQMKFYEGAITKKMCPDMSYEKAFIEMMGKVNKYQIIGKQLLFYQDNILLMTFERGKD